MKIVNLEQNSPEWLAWRISHFNASETSSVFGIGFESPASLHRRKFITKEPSQNIETEAMRLGREYEPKIRAKMSEILGIWFYPCVATYEYDEHYSASFDGYNPILNEVLEIKFSENEFNQVKIEQKPSEKYYLQVQHQLMVCGGDKAYFAVGKINADFELDIAWCEVKRDNKTIKKIIDAWENFEQKYAVSENSANLLGLLGTDLQKVESKIAELTAQSKAIKEQILHVLGEREYKNDYFSVYKTERNSIDYKKFLVDNKIEVPSQYVKNSVSWAVRVTK